MIAPSRPDLRGRGAAATVEGGFAAVWFIWAGPAPAWLVAALRVGALVALVMAAAGTVLAWSHRRQHAAPHEGATRRRFRRIAAVQFGALAAGAVLLGAAGRGQWVPVWALAVVAAHFLPLGRVFGNRLMRPLGLVLAGAAVGTTVVGLATPLAPALVAGAVAGTCLLITAALTLGGQGQPRPATVAETLLPPKHDTEASVAGSRG